MYIILLQFLSGTAGVLEHSFYLYNKFHKILYVTMIQTPHVCHIGILIAPATDHTCSLVGIIKW